ncbi:MAG: hypothetical protein JWN40_1661 [Phycisphaerales bacterium]|nr:hypothetical protein [Phycisphaerales bacterium]
MDVVKRETKTQVQKVEQRRSHAAATLRRSNEKLVKLLADRQLTGDEEYGNLKRRTVEIRGDLHGIRLNLTKKGGKFRRLLQEVAGLADTLESLHSEENHLVMQLERSLAAIEVKQVLARGEAARTL